jgi:peptidoglycan/LPS O-acetylase OafA/YrhL
MGPSRPLSCPVHSEIPSGSRFRIGYRPALDGLRAIAILMVVFFHDRKLSGGFLGVDVFFALSGFLITSLLMEEHTCTGTIGLARFYARRALRLAPALVAFVGSVFAFTHWIRADLADWLSVRWALGALLYVTNVTAAYFHDYPQGPVSICWSLGLEEQFYLLWPLTLHTMLRRAAPRVAIVAVLMAGLVSPAVLREWLVARGPGDPGLWLRVYFAPDTRADALLVGCLGALVSGWWPRAFESWKVWSVAVAGSAAMLALLASTQHILSFVTRPALFSVSALACAGLVLGAMWLPWLGRPLSAPPLVLIGRLSYSLYLWHEIGLYVGSPWGAWGRYGTAFLFAIGSHYAVERPFLRLKARLQPPGVRSGAFQAVARTGAFP